MILNLSEDGKFVMVSAFEAPPSMDPSVTLRQLRIAIPTAEVQFFDGAHVAGKEHLEIAVTNALHAFKMGTNISRSVTMETLLYASAQRQIDVALARLGVTKDSRIVGLVAFSETKTAAEELENKIARFVRTEMNEALLEDWSEGKATRIMTLYGIGTTELEAIRMPGQGVEEAVRKAVIERVALLSTRT
ncbi:KEOPS complex subunit Cgi121 [[Eubacterium] cellulosolvens]